MPYTSFRELFFQLKLMASHAAGRSSWAIDSPQHALSRPATATNPNGRTLQRRTLLRRRQRLS
jgi:hypothetical protein